MSDNNPCNPRIIDLGYDACEALLVCTISLYSHTQTLTRTRTLALTRARARTQRLFSVGLALATFHPEPECHRRE